MTREVDMIRTCTDKITGTLTSTTVTPRRPGNRFSHLRSMDWTVLVSDTKSARTYGEVLILEGGKTLFLDIPYMKE